MKGEGYCENKECSEYKKVVQIEITNLSEPYFSEEDCYVIYCFICDKPVTGWYEESKNEI